MKQMAEFKKMPEEEYNQLFNEQLVLLVLQKVDSSVTMDNIEDMHPNDFLDFFRVAWNSGRVSKVVKPFREK